MKVPFVDLRGQYLRLKPELDAAFQDIFERTAFISGKYVAAFEKAFAEAQKVKYFAGMSSGTDAVHLMLWACGVKAGDEVIVPVNTFIATAEGISLCGATPVFVDNDPDTYTIDVHQIEGKITTKTVAILPVHLYGQPADMDPILDLASRHGLAVFEDACQAHLAAYKGRAVGLFGRATAFSFFPGKNLGAYGEAGGLATNDDELYQKIYRMRGHGSVERYVHEIIGHNYRMEEIQAAVLLTKLRYLEEWTARRKAIASLYDELLKGVDGIVLPRRLPGADHVYHLYVIRVEGGRRDELQNYLKSQEIDTGLHYPIPIHLQKAYAAFGHGKGSFPVAERQASALLSLPLYPEMERDKVEYVCERIRSYFHG